MNFYNQVYLSNLLSNCDSNWKLLMDCILVLFEYAETSIKVWLTEIYLPSTEREEWLKIYVLKMYLQN